MNRFFALIFLGVLMQLNVKAQDELPNFSAYFVGGGRVVIAWTHNYPVVKQINIQRSYDSTNFFKTIVSMPDPGLKENGFSDKTPIVGNIFYRIFILLEDGKYIVTKSKKPAIDSTGLADAYKVEAAPTPVTVNFLPPGFLPSRYVFTSADRYVRVELPMDARKYDIKFFSETMQPLFELTDVKEKRFKLDRSYFYTAGYVNFELYADGKLMEKYKLFLPKEF